MLIDQMEGAGEERDAVDDHVCLLQLLIQPVHGVHFCVVPVFVVRELIQADDSCVKCLEALRDLLPDRACA